MKDMHKTKTQLLEEITDLRRKIKDFEDVSSSRPEKYHEMKQSEELYRLQDEDADEVRDRVSEEEGVRGEMSAALDSLLERHPLVVLDASEINDELRETLEALGYLR